MCYRALKTAETCKRMTEVRYFYFRLSAVHTDKLKAGEKCPMLAEMGGGNVRRGNCPGTMSGGNMSYTHDSQRRRTCGVYTYNPATSVASTTQVLSLPSVVVTLTGRRDRKGEHTKPRMPHSSGKRRRRRERCSFDVSIKTSSFERCLPSRPAAGNWSAKLL